MNRMKKITKFMKDSGWFKCECCGGFHQYTGFHLDGKSVPIKTQYNIGMGWVYPCPEILHKTKGRLKK